MTSLYVLIVLFWLTDLSYEKPTSKTVLIGENVTISCSYPNSHRSDPKFFCKMLHSGVCTYKTSVKESRTAVREEKISLNDDRAKKVFTVSIMHVNERDSGEYWCGVEAGESEDGYKVYIMRIDMTVTGESVWAQKWTDMALKANYLTADLDNWYLVQIIIWWSVVVSGQQFHVLHMVQYSPQVMWLIRYINSV